MSTWYSPPFVGIQVSGIIHPLPSSPPGHFIMSFPQFIGHTTRHSNPLASRGPVIHKMLSFQIKHVRLIGKPKDCLAFRLRGGTVFFLISNFLQKCTLWRHNYGTSQPKIGQCVYNIYCNVLSLDLLTIQLSEEIIYVLIIV